LNPEARIVSFVLRFVYDADGGSDAEDGPARGHWYSVVRHVQSDEERRFASWGDIEGFIGSYVELEPDREARDE
jgi:hypothetical protein